MTLPEVVLKETRTNTLCVLFSPVLVASVAAAAAEGGLLKFSVTSVLLRTEQPVPAFTGCNPGHPPKLPIVNLRCSVGWNMKTSDKSREVCACLYTMLLAYLHLCVFEEDNVTTACCSVKPNKVCARCQVRHFSCVLFLFS